MTLLQFKLILKEYDIDVYSSHKFFKYKCVINGSIHCVECACETKNNLIIILTSRRKKGYLGSAFQNC